MKKFISGLDRMSEEAFCMLAGTLKTCCTMVLCGFAVLVHIGNYTLASYHLYRLALELSLSPVGILLVGGIASLMLEEYRRR